MERLTSPGIEEYLDGLFPPPDPVLEEMGRIGRERGFPIVGPLVGNILEILARAIGARTVLELGSGFGYSAYWFARGLTAPGLTAPGRVVLTDGRPENLLEAKSFLERGGFPHAFEFYKGDALDRLRRDGEIWDIIFCDIDKQGYPDVVDPAVERLRPGGLLIFDNTLWSGRVLPEAGAGDAATEAVRALNRRLATHPGLRSTILPVRDGLAVAVKI
jgi:caffeoyl-CoA O-methyltransferase